MMRKRKHALVEKEDKNEDMRNVLSKYFLSKFKEMGITPIVIKRIKS